MSAFGEIIIVTTNVFVHCAHSVSVHIKRMTFEREQEKQQQQQNAKDGLQEAKKKRNELRQTIIV